MGKNTPPQGNLLKNSRKGKIHLSDCGKQRNKHQRALTYAVGLALKPLPAFPVCLPFTIGAPYPQFWTPHRPKNSSLHHYFFLSFFLLPPSYRSFPITTTTSCRCLLYYKTTYMYPKALCSLLDTHLITSSYSSVDRDQPFKSCGRGTIFASLFSFSSFASLFPSRLSLAQFNTVYHLSLLDNSFSSFFFSRLLFSGVLYHGNALYNTFPSVFLTNLPFTMYDIYIALLLWGRILYANV